MLLDRRESLEELVSRVVLVLLALLVLPEHLDYQASEASEDLAARSDHLALLVPRVYEVIRATWGQLDRKALPGCPVCWAHWVLSEL